MAQRPSPQSIGICALIALYSDPNSLLHELEDDVGSKIAVSENRVAAFLEESVFGNNNDRNKTTGRIVVVGKSQTTGATTDSNNDALTKWLVKMKRRLGTQAVELLLDTLDMASESVDALMDLFDSLKGAIHERLVDATSLHGVYLRQYCLGFDELSFESAILLWQALKERVLTIEQNGLDVKTKTTDNGESGSSGNINNSNNNNGNSDALAWPLSTDQMQAILRQDCIDFEVDQDKNDGDGNLVGYDNEGNSSVSHRTGLTFEKMEVYIRKILKHDPELPAAHFLRYLNCLRHGERVGALDALHEYFDHSMAKHIAAGSSNNSGGRGGATADGGAATRTSRDILQFSVILLAMTHSAFGDSNLALLATEEAVRVAQQSKDAACVAFALGWLYEHHGQGTAERRELLRRCATRASQGKLRPLVSGAQLTLAKHALLGEHSAGGVGGGNNNNHWEPPPAFSAGGEQRTDGAPHEGHWTTSWNHLLLVTAEASTDHSGALDRPTYLSQNPKEVLQSMALQRLVSASIWDSLGMPAMSKWASEAALNQRDELSYQDLLAAIQNISRCALHGSPPTMRGTKVFGRRQRLQEENECDANTVDKRSRTKDHHPSCSYARAVIAIIQLRIELGLEGNDLEEPIIHNLALIFHEWAVNRGDLDDAMALQTMLDSCVHPGLYNKDHLYADIRMQKYLYFRRTKNTERAREVGASLVKYCKSKGLLKSQARILIQMGVTELETDRGRCTSALSPLLEAIALCEKWEMHGLHAAAMSILAQVFLRLQNPKRAIAVIDATLPTLLQREHIWFQAEAYLTLTKARLRINAKSAATKPGSTADATVGPATTRTRNSSAQKRQLHNALKGLNKSMRLFEECHDRHRLREVCYLQAQINSLLCNTKKRDAMAEKYLKLGVTDNNLACRVGSLLDAISNPHEIQLLVGRSIY